MDGMDMSGMGGMDSDGMFRPYSQWLATVYWYLIAVAFGVGLSMRLFQLMTEKIRMRHLHASNPQPTRPQNWFTQIVATSSATIRELSYPQGYYIAAKRLSWLTPPSLGRVLVILLYWIIITIMITNESIVDDAFYWERVAFRAAWISVTQVPLVFLLAGKVNLVGFLIGSSHDRLNWIHRWVARTLFITVTIHGSFFMAEWVRSEFVSLELEMMPMVKYGMGAWCVLLWINISSLAPIRHLGHEFFVLQHLVSSIILLWLLWTHVPAYAMYNIWIAISFLAFDRAAFMIWTMFLNFLPRRQAQHTLSENLYWGKPVSSRFFGLTWEIGHQAHVKACEGDITAVTLKTTDLSWRPGQHIYLWIPRLSGIESHPYTISNVQEPTSELSSQRDLKLVIRAHSGFSRRLHKKAYAAQHDGPLVMTALIVGPFGAPPVWNAYETVVLVAASTGGSFTVPILESLLKRPGCVAQIRFLLLVQETQHSNCYVGQLRQLASQALSLGRARTSIEIAVSRNTIGDDATFGCSCSSSPSAETKIARVNERPVSSSCYLACQAPIHFSFGKKNLESFIRPPVEAAFGETMVAVCGGRRLTSDVRNFVTKLSDERAVHKGTGAQGIRLYVEGYAF